MIKLGGNNIGKIYLGNNSIGKAYLGSNLVFQKGSSPTPTLVSYIRGGANGSYIDTGITPDSTTKVILWARNVNPGAGFLFGARVSASVSALSLWSGNNQYSGSFQYRFGSNGPLINDLFSYLSHYSKYEISNEGLKINDELIDSLSTPGTFDCSYNLVLFGVNTAGTVTTSLLPADICACKIYKNDVLVRDFTAVNSPSVGLYDAVSDTVFTNAGTGTFTYGEFNPNAYTPLEYITSDGTSYIQTDIQATYSMPAVGVFMPTGTVARFYRFVGARDESPTNMFEFATGNDTYRNARLYLNFGTSSSTAYTSNTNDYFKDKKIVAVKNNNVMSAYVNNSQVGDTITGASNTSFTVSQPTQIFSSSGVGDAQMFIGRGYIMLLGDSCFVPAKVNGVAGMYDTYNDTFYSSSTSTPFTAGPEL